MGMFDLTGKVAIVTGATKGIGHGIARAFAAQGAKVLIASRDVEACRDVASALDDQFGGGSKIAHGLALDLDERATFDSFAAEALAVWDGVDLLVCNAAILPFIGPPEQTPPELFDRILTRNVHHNFRLCQALRGPIAARGGGAITLIASEAAHKASPMVLAYAAAKAGLAQMTLSLADEMANEHIRVNCVSPGLIRSAASTGALGESGFETAAKSIPLGRVGEPADIAGAVVYLSSDAAAHVTGETIIVDGGRSRLTSRGESNHLKHATGTSFN